MKRSWLKIALLVLFCSALGFEIWHFRSGSGPAGQGPGSTTRKAAPDFTLLPATEIDVWSKYFASGVHAESWEPTLGDMNDMEADVVQITALSKSEPDSSRRIESPKEYYRQYLALQINGNRKIFLNAICSVDHEPNWRKHLVVVRDGGKCFWHAMYDLSTRTFSDFSMNAQA